MLNLIVFFQKKFLKYFIIILDVSATTLSIFY